MVLQMAASMAFSAVVFMLLLVCSVFNNIPAISFTRGELLDIRKYTPPDISPDYVYSDVLLDIVVGGAAVLFRLFSTRRRGKRAGELVKLHQRELRMPLPSIQLANLRSLPNKMDERLLLSRLNKDFYNSAALCFTETWLNVPFQTARFNFRMFSWSDLFVMQNQRQWDVLLHQWEVVYRHNSVKEDVLFWSRNALHQLQTVQLAGFCLFIFVRLSTFLRKRMWYQLYRNSLIWSQTQKNNTLTLF